MNKALWFKVVVDDVERTPMTAMSREVALRRTKHLYPHATTWEVSFHRWNDETTDYKELK